MLFRGVFIFNFYHQPALFINALSPKNIKKQIKDITVNRISNAMLNPNLNCLQLDYYYILYSDYSHIVDSFEIHEIMRYFSTMELDYMLKEAGFSSTNFVEWGTNNELTPTMWNGCCIAKI